MCILVLTSNEAVSCRLQNSLFPILCSFRWLWVTYRLFCFFQILILCHKHNFFMCLRYWLTFRFWNIPFKEVLEPQFFIHTLFFDYVSHVNYSNKNLISLKSLQLIRFLNHCLKFVILKQKKKKEKRKATHTKF